ncbi:MAG: phasin, PhaP, partial [Rhodobacteraceae bacterium]|nr:phasin, PhaP [Paracoccaceae bacterium]
MTNLNDMTGFFKDMMGAFPIDPKSFEEAMKG